MRYAQNVGDDFRDPGIAPPHTMASVISLWGSRPMGALTYVPNLTPTGAGTAYYPGDVRADAEALRYLGYPAPTAGLGGAGQAADMSGKNGAWNPAFQAAVRQFQAAASPAAGPVDGWIGVQTRVALGAAVAAKNAAEAPPLPVPTPPQPAQVIPVPPPQPAQPAQVIPLPSLPSLPPSLPQVTPTYVPTVAPTEAPPEERPTWHYAVGFGGLALLGGAIGWALSGPKRRAPRRRRAA